MATLNDNFYKFLSILGLLLFLCCVLLPAVSLELNFRETNQVRRNLVQLSQERESLISKIKEYEQTLAENDTLAPKDELLARGKDVDKYRSDVDLKTKQLDLEHELFNEQQERGWIIRQVMLGALILSVILLVSGLAGWYLNIQRPKNRLIRQKLFRNNKATE